MTKREITEAAGKQYDLEDRTHAFARAVRALVKALPKSVANHEDAKQVVRSSGSVGCELH